MIENSEVICNFALSNRKYKTYKRKIMTKREWYNFILDEVFTEENIKEWVKECRDMPCLRYEVDELIFLSEENYTVAVSVNNSTFYIQVRCAQDENISLSFDEENSGSYYFSDGLLYARVLRYNSLRELVNMDLNEEI